MTIFIPLDVHFPYFLITEIKIFVLYFYTNVNQLNWVPS